MFSVGRADAVIQLEAAVVESGEGKEENDDSGPFTDGEGL